MGKNVISHTKCTGYNQQQAAHAASARMKARREKMCVDLDSIVSFLKVTNSTAEHAAPPIQGSKEGGREGVRATGRETPHYSPPTPFSQSTATKYVPPGLSPACRTPRALPSVVTWRLPDVEVVLLLEIEPHHLLVQCHYHEPPQACQVGGLVAGSGHVGHHDQCVGGVVQDDPPVEEWSFPFLVLPPGTKCLFLLLFFSVNQLQRVKCQRTRITSLNLCLSV
jgi:hypothetical protein